MQLLARSERLWTLDLMRGFFIFTMTLSHAIYFFHAKINPLLLGISGFADFISFSGLLFVAGASAFPAYIHERRSSRTAIRHVIKRLFIYTLGYYSLSTYILYGLEQLNFTSFYQVISFQRLVPFTEFIIPFLILGFLKLPLIPIYRYLVKNPLFLFIVSFCLYLTGSILAPASSSIPDAWKAIFVWHEASFSFPLFHYLPVYLFGLFFGFQFHQLRPRQLIHKLFQSLILTFGLGILALLSYQILGFSPDAFTRWPPSLSFLLLTTSAVLFIGFIIKFTQDLIHLPWTRNFLLLLGQNAFSLFFTHTVIVYTYQFLGFPPVYSSLLVIVLYLISLILALYLAKFIPLNYSTALTWIAWCECHVGLCVHAHEPKLIRLLKHQFIKISQIPRHFHFHFRSKPIYLFTPSKLIVSLGLFFVLATPLGLIENQYLTEAALQSFSGEIRQNWVLTTDTKPLLYTLSLPAFPQSDQSEVTAQLDSTQPLPMHQVNQTYQVQFDPTSLNPGRHQITAQVQVKKTSYTSKPSTFYVSRPLYVTWTIDWEGYDVSNSLLNRLSQLASEFDIPLTHMFNPRIYTAPEINASRADYLTNWVINRRDTLNEEIGLHLHMFPDFVTGSGLPARLEPVWGGGFTPGYDILTTAYSYEEMVTVLNFAKKTFQSKGLGTPISYRAGAWFANLDTLKALSDTGFLIDTSARTSYSFGTNQVAGFWQIETTQSPYFPSSVDQNRDFPPPNLPILEIPNNGADDYAFSAEAMINRFDQNYVQVPLTEFTQVTFLSHPHWLTPEREKKMRQVFSYVNQFSYRLDRGPIQYVTLREIYDAFINQ